VNLPPGPYRVDCVDCDANPWFAATKWNQVSAFLPAGSNTQNIDFYANALGGIVGRVFEDNGDGSFDPATEHALAGVQLTLVPNPRLVPYSTSAVSNAAGLYAFPHLPAGQYTVTCTGCSQHTELMMPFMRVATVVENNQTTLNFGGVRPTVTSQVLTWPINPATGARCGDEPYAKAGINDAGNIVGTVMYCSFPLINQSGAVLWTPSGQMVDISPHIIVPHDDGYSEDYLECGGANAVNARGTVAMDCNLPARITESGGGHAAMRTSAGGLIFLEDGDATTSYIEGTSYARAINDSDAVVGDVYFIYGSAYISGAVITRGRVWQGGLAQDLGDLGGKSTSPESINNSGEVVGVSEAPGGLRHAFYWTASSGIRDLGTLPFGRESQAFDINDSGQIIGVSNGGPSGWEFVLWDRSGVIHDLGFGYPCIQLSCGEIARINNKGQILASPVNGRAAFIDPVRGVFTLPFYAHDLNNTGQLIGNTVCNGFMTCPTRFVLSIP
jgi:probable HAF family extracellular repeat protein